MNVGYVRLSRDDDKRNYVSIKNQKLIINQYAVSQGISIDRWYEDDGVSGYIFDRPGFNQLMEDLDKDVDTVFVKDFSRLGRHNAKVLLLLDDFQERGKHLIAIDDNYDSQDTNDDMIGIKTWFNERYIKDTSKKIKRAIGARQKEGTLKTQPPFGYKRNEKDNSVFQVIPAEAEYVKMVYDLYISGYGYRKIANYLTAQNIPTPSMIRHTHELEEGRITKRHIATVWTDGMVKNLLGNDFYTGTLRLKKRARSTVHGKDRRVPKDEQYVFKNNHPAIIDRAAFDLVQDIREKRNRNNYRGSHGQPIGGVMEIADEQSVQAAWAEASGNDSHSWTPAEIPNPFGSCLFCKDCRKRLTPIKRETTRGKRKYYICTTYNTKGRHYCAKAHLIEENDLMEDVVAYVRLCRNTLCEVIETYDPKDFGADKKSMEEKRQNLQSAIKKKKGQLKILFKQKIKDLSTANENEGLINETYDSLKKDLLATIDDLEMQLKKLNETNSETPATKDKLKNALDVVDKIIAGKILYRKDIELLIEKIEVDENGLPEITLKYGLSGQIQYNPADEMNYRENMIIITVMKLIMEDTRGYTSAKYLSEHLTGLGVEKTRTNVLPYIGLMKEMQIMEPAKNPLKPYNIVKNKEEINALCESFLPYTPDKPSEKPSGETAKKDNEMVDNGSANTQSTKNELLQMTAQQFSEVYLHSKIPGRRHAADGI